MKVDVKTAQSDLNTFDFEFAHGTTEKFYEPNVPLIMEVRKGVSMELEMAAMRRVDPMPLPPMSLVRFNTRYYYVPMIDICPYYNDLDNRTPYAFRYGQATAQKSSFIPDKTPVIKTKDIKLLLFNGINVQWSLVNNVLTPNYAVNKNRYVEIITDADQIANKDYDLHIYAEPVISGNTYTGDLYFKYTDVGRLAYKILKQLGYDFAVTRIDKFNSQVYDYNNAQSDEFSALPLLAYVKVYLNFYESAQYINNTDRLSRLNSLLHIDVEHYSLTDVDLDLIVDLFTYVTYELDYFTTSFVNPANGNNFLENLENITIKDNTTLGDIEINTNDGYQGTPVVVNTNDEAKYSQNSLNLLKRLSNYLKRHQIAGGRMVDRALVEYGISIDNSYSRRSSYIDTISSVLNITPVLNTTSEQLGEYAGFGSSSTDMKNNKIKINVPEQDGYIIGIDTIIPEMFYSQGYNRQNRHITKFDFVASTDFDAVGVQAIEQGEILMTKDGMNYHNNQNPSSLTFGFKPRGAEYKERVSYLTGDFICNSINRDIDSYFTDRRFDEKYYLDTDNRINITTSRAFVSSYDKKQFARIFYANIQNTDYIKSIFRFKIHLVAPYQSLYEEYKLIDSPSNKHVKMNVGGRQMQ